MKSLLWLTLMLVGVVAATQSLPGAPNSKTEPPNGLIGAWKLVSLEEHSVSIAMEEVKPQEWVEKVYKPDILNKWDNVYKKPGYDPSDL